MSWKTFWRREAPQKFALEVRGCEALEQAVSVGVRRGWAKAHKYEPAPTTDHILEDVENEVLEAVHEVFYLYDRLGDEVIK